jgi:tellurite resistance protein
MSQEQAGDRGRRGELSLLIGVRFYFRTSGQGALHCQRCGGDRLYQRCTGRRWVHVLHIPVIPLDRIGEHVQCRSCRTRYRLEVLGMPTVAAMQAALPAGSLAAVTTMLRAGDPASAPARSRAVEMVQRAGVAGYDDATLTADLAAAREPAADISASLRTLARQLIRPAPEWFLADAVRVGLADGPLSEEERAAAQLIASYLGMTSAQAHGVIWLTEEGAAAG